MHSNCMIRGSGSRISMKTNAMDAKTEKFTMSWACMSANHGNAVQVWMPKFLIRAGSDNRVGQNPGIEKWHLKQK